MNNRPRRGRRKGSGNGSGNSGGNSNAKNQNARSIPSSHKSSSRNRRGKKKNSKTSISRPTGESYQSVAPSPLVALHKIESSSPVGTGLNPLAESFRNASSSDKKPNESKFYKVLFFDTFQDAKKSSSRIDESCSGCDQLNVVIKAEGNMEDPDLLGINQKVKVFAGEAWTLIHNRRLEEGWYEAAQ